MQTLAVVRRSPGALAVAGAALVTILALAACDRRPQLASQNGAASNRAPVPLALRMIADSARVETLPVNPPLEARAWMTHVSPSRPASLLPETPALALDSLDALEWPPPPAADVDPGLKPPILRTPGALRLAGGTRSPRASVELDVRVDEWGDVSDALWAGGTDDSLLVAAAIESALAMRFYPALRADRPVAVWCRQRFDFGVR
jgi:hypothetical protein